MCNKKIYDIAPDMYYKNVHLMKDCCLIPYTFGKLYGYIPVIVTADAGDYTYLNDMPEYVMDFQPAFDNIYDWGKHCTKYIETHYSDMDILFCFGPYPTYFDLIPLYKKLRPDGKVILKLDANMDWMDRIPYALPQYDQMFSNCDIISCECSKVKKYISAKWPYIIDYIPNGFSSNSDYSDTDYSTKENIILTVAEIGREQKNHPLLLEAFAQSAPYIPDWKLKLVGEINEDFIPYINDYFSIHPELIDRVIFTGQIIDKNELYSEYSKAKIFALTSDFEGGTPNVFSESAKFGCYTVCTDIDAADEFTNFGKNGIITPRGNANQLSEVFIKICNNSYEQQFLSSFHSMKEYVHRYYNYETIVKKMYFILYNL